MNQIITEWTDVVSPVRYIHSPQVKTHVLNVFNVSMTISVNRLTCRNIKVSAITPIYLVVHQKFWLSGFVQIYSKLGMQLITFMFQQL